jgi:penicillin-binding protein 1B
MTRRKKTGARKKKGKRGKRKQARGNRLRLYRALAVVATVVALVGFLHAYVSVTSRFGDQIWPIPSRVYSDVLVLAPGTVISADELARRLEDSGYSRTTGPPRRPGQFHASGGTVEVDLREFDAPRQKADIGRYVVSFRDGRVGAVRDAGGGWVDRLVVEPVPLATLYGARHEERYLLGLEEVPEGFKSAVLSAEDARFYRHHGIDFRGILRAAWANLTHGRIVQGGSTITQQTVKNLYLGQQRTWWRKFREVGMSVILDARYQKDEILEVYLNEVYLGQRGPVAVCGVEAAARFYFGLPLDDLSLGEWALLAGLIRSPGSYNPFVHPDRAVERRGQVLQAMQRLGHIDASAAEAAASEPLRLATGSRARESAPYAVDFVQAHLAERYPPSVLETRGLRIYTTIDPTTQARAAEALKQGLERLERDYPAIRRQLGQRRLQGAVVVTSPGTGAIRALVGGRDHDESQFDRATQARRQPGSCFKPMVFATGFEAAVRNQGNGLTPSTLLEDSPIELVSGGKAWSPANYDKTFRGSVTVRQALEQSLNVPTVRAAERVGLEQVVEVAHACGIDSPMKPLPSLALGTFEVSPLELAAAYGTFANGGVRYAPWIIRSVTDSEGNVLEGQGIRSERALSPQTAFLLTDLMLGVFERGTAKTAAVHGYRGGAAGKTGTTDDTRDSWFVGYSADRLALVWVGYDDNARTGLTGATGALPIWVRIMAREAAAAPLRVGRTQGLVRRKIDPESGDLATGGCPRVVEEYFVKGTEPTRDCALHQGRFKRWLRKFLGKKRTEQPADAASPG